MTGRQAELLIAQELRKAAAHLEKPDPPEKMTAYKKRFGSHKALAKACVKLIFDLIEANIIDKIED